MILRTFSIQSSVDPGVTIAVQECKEPGTVCVSIMEGDSSSKIILNEEELTELCALRYDVRFQKSAIEEKLYESCFEN
mgnify:CR=1 FL=1